MTNLRIVIKGIQAMSVVLLLFIGVSRFVWIILPPPVHTSIEDLGLGAIFLVAGIGLLRRWNWLRFVPKSGIGRVYFELVYGILLTWFIICLSWDSALRGPKLMLPADLTLQTMKALMLCSVPPAAGMSADLLIARWLDKQYRPMAVLIGAVFIAYSILTVGVLLI